ncbi:FlhC family transcriptional regulator [Kosakonia oryziphila]|uniref:FlhC family transcriptional regulator n=1 Tax=Kosakonia oryziphila TaxID=1005667 RepID=UPI000A746D25|nr:FlhC family transcriptional regulator [Kosakonia oryziphila]
MVDKSIYFELQKLSLALFLATKSSAARLFIDDDNQPVNNSAVNEPSRAIDAEDPHTRLHVRHFFNNMQLLKTHTRTSECQQVIEAWRYYCNDCLIDGQSVPLLNLVQGWDLIETCQSQREGCITLRGFDECGTLHCADSVFQQYLPPLTELATQVREKDGCEHCCCQLNIPHTQSYTADK